MKIFLSWSGRRSQAVAEGLRTWLKMLIQAVEPWTSSEDIRRGKRWGIELAATLSESNFGIVCLTPENVNQKWILFEAGALAKNLSDSRVCTFLLQLKPTDLEPPLSDFQATMADKKGSLKLALEINQCLPSDRRMDPEALQKLFTLLWPLLEKSLLDASQITIDEPVSTVRTDRELLEDILETVRQKPSITAGDRVVGIDIFDEMMTHEHNPRHRSKKFLEFRPGSIVEHPTFGKGTVKERFKRGSRVGVSVDFEIAGHKDLILDFARLQLVSDVPSS